MNNIIATMQCSAGNQSANSCYFDTFLAPRIITLAMGHWNVLKNGLRNSIKEPTVDTGSVHPRSPSI